MHYRIIFMLTNLSRFISRMQSIDPVYDSDFHIYLLFRNNKNSPFLD